MKLKGIYEPTCKALTLSLFGGRWTNRLVLFALWTPARSCVGWHVMDDARQSSSAATLAFPRR